MMQASSSDIGRNEAPERQIDGPFISLDLPFEIAQLVADRAYEEEGHAGRTLAKYPDLRVVLEAMSPETRLRIHETAERMTVQVISGVLRVWLEYGDNYDLAEGSFAAIDAARVHEIECLEPCAFLLTLAWPPAAGAKETNGGGI
jgi:quercetin dioxygenase-like cupin family protein